MLEHLRDIRGVQRIKSCLQVCMGSEADSHWLLEKHSLEHTQATTPNPPTPSKCGDHPLLVHLQTSHLPHKKQ